jgi:uncharacterized protein
VWFQPSLEKDIMHAALIIFTTIIVFLAVVYISVCCVVAHIMTRAKRTSPYRNTAWGKHEINRITFSPRASGSGSNRDNFLKLAGWFIPVESPQGAILLVHGKDCCRGEELNTNTYELVKAFGAEGFSTLLIDLRGHGESDFARMTYGLHESNDVLGALDWLKLKGFGASMGGACAIAAAAQEPSIGALVTDSTFSDFDDMMRRKFRKLSGMPTFFLPGALLIGCIVTRTNFRTNKPVNHVESFKGRPMMVIHSDADQFVPLDHAQALAKAGNAQLWVTRSDHHMASYRTDPSDYQRRVTLFFCKSIGVVQLREAA